MTLTTNSLRTATAMGAIGIAATALALPTAAQAQIVPAMTDVDVQSLPPELQSGPVTTTVDTNFDETSIGPDGVETITRTRRIESSYPATTTHTGQPQSYAPTQAYAPSQGYTPAQGYAPAYGYAPAATVFERDQWIDECESRTNGRGDREKGGIIGGLLGAIAGGLIGNRVSDSERLGGTLIGAGVGGLGGLVLGNLIGGGRNSRGDYDCEAALDSYLSQHGQPGAYPVARVAARTIPAPTYAAPAQYGYGYAPAYQPYSYTYAPPQQIVYVPVQYEQQQRVIVRETVREETVPGASRVIPAPRPVPVPRQPRYIKGN